MSLSVWLGLWSLDVGGPTGGLMIMTITSITYFK